MNYSKIHAVSALMVALCTISAAGVTISEFIAAQQQAYPCGGVVPVSNYGIVQQQAYPCGVTPIPVPCPVQQQAYPCGVTPIPVPFPVQQQTPPCGDDLSTGTYILYAENIDPKTGRNNPVDIYLTYTNGILNPTVRVNSAVGPLYGLFYGDGWIVDENDVKVTPVESYFEITEQSTIGARFRLTPGGSGEAESQTRLGRNPIACATALPSTARVAYDATGDKRVTIIYEIVNGLVDVNQKVKVYPRY